MPNWVTNRIKMTGDQKSIQELIEFIRSDESEVDFNKIVPMPKELNMVSGGYQNEYVKCYLDSLPKEEADEIKEKLKWTKCFFYGDYYKKFYAHDREIDADLLKRMEEDAKKSYPMVEDKTITGIGKQYVDNVLNYGTDDWYDWCCRFWGTKWNACEPNVYDNIIEFNTAWSSVPQLILKLAQKFPDITIHYYYADEDFGNNVGAFTFHGEDVDVYQPEGGSEEAYDLASDILGYDMREDEDWEDPEEEERGYGEEDEEENEEA